MRSGHRSAPVVPSLAQLVERARALVFDFDGTLVESNAIKRRAFERCFADAPAAHQADIQAYCRGFNHTPRWEKFRHIYEHILHRTYTPVIETELLRRFEAETTRQIVEAPEIRGASAFLAQAARTHVTALLSSAPQEILMKILEDRGWRGYFQTVQGAPVDKAQWLAGWRRKHPDTLFFGDTPEDARAAQAAGCSFVIVGDSTPDAETVCAIQDFSEPVSVRR